jgi:capsular polysaccharide export protein
LREHLVRAQLTKYNVQSARPPVVDPEGRRVLLVVGQVDGDASVRLGGGEIRSTGALVRAVREANPKDFLLFKPHPDVVAGNRPGHLTEAETALVDHVEEHASSLACLSVAREVHTLTSLLGFEALLRGIPVYTYGLPFYAGWGLTIDRMTCPRRTRHLTLDELTYQALIAYPYYISQKTGYHAEVEEVVYELEQSKRQEASDVQASLRRQLGRAARFVRGVFDVF